MFSTVSWYFEEIQQKCMEIIYLTRKGKKTIVQMIELVTEQ